LEESGGELTVLPGAVRDQKAEEAAALRGLAAFRRAAAVSDELEKADRLGHVQPIGRLALTSAISAGMLCSAGALLPLTGGKSACLERGLGLADGGDQCILLFMIARLISSRGQTSGVL